MRMFDMFSFLANRIAAQLKQVQEQAAVERRKATSEKNNLIAAHEEHNRQLNGALEASQQENQTLSMFLENANQEKSTLEAVKIRRKPS